MSIGIVTVVAIIAFGAFALWLYRSRTALGPQSEQDDFERGDRARALELAKIQADLQRWNGPH